MNFINFSNHPSSKWDETQTNAAKVYGDVVDISFPSVPADVNFDIQRLADECCQNITKQNPAAVMVQGEMTLVFAVVKKLQAQGITCLAAVSERKSVEKQMEDGSVVKTAIFEFKGFRVYL